MKIGLAADAHFGIHSNHESYARSLDMAFEAMGSELMERDVNALVFLGDLFDTRFSINQAAEDSARRNLEKLEKNFIELVMLPGNHDSYYSNTVRINSLNKFGRMARIVSKPEVLFGTVLALPWICEENQEECLNSIKKAEVPYCMGHFDIYGAKMNNAKTSEEGLKLSVFKKFDKVFSGHFHSKQTLGNVEYIGSLVQTSFADLDEQRGFAIFDTETGVHEFIVLNGMKHLRIQMSEDFDIEDYDVKDNAVELLVPDDLWDDRLTRKAEKAIIDAGASYFAGSRKNLEEAEESISSLPSMKRNEKVIDYIEKYVGDASLSNKDEVLKELRHLHEAVSA